MTQFNHHPSVPDDTALTTSLPQGQVDYLSHVWKEEDVWRSWRNMTRQKNAIANGTRLENASWRTWWKQRNKLKTISPETLNWLKDSDVTWLYGPLHSAVEAVPPPKVATAAERLGLLESNPLKPILKHRSIVEMLTNHMPASPVMDGYIEFDYDASDASASYFPPLDAPTPSHASSGLARTKSDTNLLRYQMPSERGHRHRSPPDAPDHASSSGALAAPMANHSARPSPPLRRSTESPRQHADADHVAGKRHISFNTFVEQCIAIEKPAGSRSDDDISEGAEEDDSEDDVLQFRARARDSHRTGGSLPSAMKPSLSRHSSQSSERSHVTIAPIPPTILKTSESFPEDAPAVVYAPPVGSSYSNIPPPHVQFEEEVSFQSGRSSSGISHRAGQTAYPRAPIPPDSDDDEYTRSADFDLHVTPDLAFGDQFNNSGASSPRGRREDGTGARHVGTGPNGVGTTIVNGHGRRHHRSSPSPDATSPTARSSMPIDIVHSPTGASSPLLAAPVESYFSRGRSGSGGSPGERSESRGRSSVRGSSSSLSDSRSGSRNRIGSTSPIGSISPNSSRSGSGYNVRRGSSDLIAAAGEVRKGTASLSPPINAASPKTSPPTYSPNGVSPNMSSPGSSAPTLKQALKAKEQIIRPSLVINRDQMGPGGSHVNTGSGGPTSPLSPSEAARKRDDYWADNVTGTATKSSATPVPTSPRETRPKTTTSAAPPPESPTQGSAGRAPVDDGTLVGRAVDIVSSARGMIRGIFNTRE